MFERKGMDIRISKVYKDFATCKEDWGGFSRSARIDSKEFEYDPDNFLYYRARAITADVSNSNGDYFPIKEVKAAYESFIGKGVYLNHDNDIPEKAFGLVLDAEMVETPNVDRSHGTGYVEILAAVDKELAEDLHPGLVRRIQASIINSTSMSCFATAASCCICNNMAHTPQELCAHMNPGTFSYIKGKRIDPYDIAYEINYGITFTEDSLVDNPADNTARIFEVMSSAKDVEVDKMSVGELKTKLKEIIALLEGVQAWKN